MLFDFIKFYLDNKPSTSAQAQLAKETNGALNNKYLNSPLSNKYRQRNKWPKYDNTIYYKKALKRCLGAQTTPKEKRLLPRQMKCNEKLNNLKQLFQSNPKRNANASEDGDQPKPKRKKPINSKQKTKKSTTQQADIPTTLEEGEILDIDDTLPLHNSIDNNKEEDCICIEPQIESIVIEDDAPCNNEPLPLEYRTLINSFCQQMTSTPQQRKKQSPKTKQQKPSIILSNEPLPFYEDVLGRPLFRFQKGTNIKYNNQLSALGRKDDSPTKKALSKNKENTNNNDKSNINYNHAHDDVIVLDDTNVTLISVSDQTPKPNDDSVVFVSETKKTEFIPLSSKDVPNPITMPVEHKTPPCKRPHSPDLFTASEKKSLNAYNSNAYNPNTGKEKTRQKRMIIIDGSNVAYSHSLNKNFSVQGVKIVLTYFEKMGHEVKVVVPQFRLGRYKSTEPEELERLHGQGKIVFTPCKKLPGKSSTCYDDRFILQLACELDAVIVSNDNYRDLIHENTAFKKIIENRVIGYTWCNDIFILPKDPYGKWGPPLNTILNRL